jgi:outer membrane protein OmpA-like peptidoglycan-associated protein
MRNRILKIAGLLALCLPTLALAQQRPEPMRGADTWEFSAGLGIKIMDRALLSYLASGSATTRFTESSDPGRVIPAAAVRVGYNFSRHLGFSLGAEGATGSGVTYLTSLAAITYTVDLNARTSPFITLGSQMTHVAGNNDRLTHPTWGAHLGVGVRRMVGEHLALRLEGRMATEHYAELPGAKATYPSVITLGASYFVGGRRPRAERAAAPCRPCMLARVDTIVRRDTVMRVRADTVRLVHVDTVRMLEPQPDQLVLRVQFETDKTALLPKSRPVLDTIALAILATPGSHWEVQGHTDSVGTREHNRILGQGRAQTVVDYLARRGVDRGILNAVGFGYDRPVFSNSTVYGRAQNRRVQLRRIPPPPTGQPVP